MVKYHKLWAKIENKMCETKLTFSCLPWNFAEPSSENLQ